MSGRSPERFVHVGEPPRPLIVRKTCPGADGVLTLNPENVAIAVFPVASPASTSTSVTKRAGNGAALIVAHVGTAPVPSTVEEREICPLEAPVKITSLPAMRLVYT